MIEGPFWKQLRGLGLTYSYSTRFDIEQGLIQFMLTKSTNLSQAYSSARNIIENLDSGVTVFDANLFDIAKTALFYDIVSTNDKYSTTALQNFMNNIFRNVNVNYNDQLLKSIVQMNITEMKTLLTHYFKPLFNPNIANVAIVSNSIQVEEIIKQFNIYNTKLTTITSLNELNNVATNTKSHSTTYTNENNNNNNCIRDVLCDTGFDITLICSTIIIGSCIYKKLY
jgi:Zn-dependent M16 (insulinase) family peptidase